MIGLSVNTSCENERTMKQAVAAMLLTKETAVDELYRAINQAIREALRKSDEWRVARRA